MKGGRTSSGTIMNRRHEMVEEILFRDQPVRAVCELLSDKYGVAVSSLISDWAQRDLWLDDVINLENSKLVVFEILFKLKSLYEDATALAVTSKNQSARVGALRLKRELVMDVYRVYTELGTIKMDRTVVSPETLEAMEWLEAHKTFFEGAQDESSIEGKSSPVKLTVKTVNK